MKFTNTPPIMMGSLCHTGFDLYSHGCGSAFSCEVSIDSSIIPAILQYPPNGSQPIPHSVVSGYLRQSPSGSSCSGICSTTCRPFASTMISPSASRLGRSLAGTFLAKNLTSHLPFILFALTSEKFGLKNM